MSSPELDGADISDRIQLLDADSVNATHAQTRSLGRMADLCAWLAGAQSNCPPTFPERTRLIVFSGTHRSGAAVSSLAAEPDLGSMSVQVNPHLNRYSTHVVDTAPLTDPAVDREAIMVAFNAGRALADTEVDAGTGLFLLAATGPGSTTSAATIVGLLCGSDVATVTGRGLGIDDALWMRKAAIVRDLMRAGRHHISDPIGLLAATESNVAAGMAGFLLQSAIRQTPVILDDLLPAAAALIGQRISYRSTLWWAASQVTPEPAHAMALDRLDLAPLLDLEIRQGGGFGVQIAADALRAAVEMISVVT